MLSPREREFLHNPEKFTRSYARWLCYNIGSKILKHTRPRGHFMDIAQALENYLIANSNVAENPNIGKLISREKLPKKRFGRIYPHMRPQAGFGPETYGLQDFK